MFSVDGKRFNRFMTDNDLDTKTNMVIRREITANGKSRAL